MTEATATESTAPVVADEAPAAEEVSYEAAEAARVAAVAGMLDGRVPPKADEDAPAPTPEPVVEAAPAEPAEVKPEELVSPQIAAVVRAQKRSEEQIAAKKAELDALRASIDADKGKLLSSDEHYRKLRVDPIAALKAAGITDTEAWLRTAYEAQLPEAQRPKDHRDRAAVLSVAEELREVKATLAAREAAEAARAEADAKAVAAAEVQAQRDAAAATYQQQISAGLTDASLTAAPSLRAYVAHDKAKATADLYAFADAHYSKTQEVLTPEQLVTHAEAVLVSKAQEAERFVAMIRPNVTTTTTKPAAPTTIKAAPTITAGATATPTKSRTPATTDEERLKRAIEMSAGIFRDAP